MRRFLVWTLAPLVLVMAGGQAALAKEGHTDPREKATGVLDPIPTDLQPGKPWIAWVSFRDLSDVGHPRVTVDGFQPTLTLHNLGSGEMIGIPVLLAAPGLYVARVVFPEAGRWSIMLRDGYNGITNDVTTVTVPPATRSAPHRRAFPIWAWLMSGLLSMLVVTGGVRIVAGIRRRRPAAIT